MEVDFAEESVLRRKEKRGEYVSLCIFWVLGVGCWVWVYGFGDGLFIWQEDVFVWELERCWVDR